MRRSLSPLVADLEPIGLPDVLQRADLQDRVDVKYIVSQGQLEEVVDRLAGTHAVLELDGLRALAYETTYFDTPGLTAYRAHVQGRRRRWKCRARAYADTGSRAVEVKLKGARGRTVKHRVEDERSVESARALLDATLLRAYGARVEADLQPALAMRFHRTTLVARGERLTCDAELRFEDGGGLAAGHVIVESKSRDGRALADRALRAAGARPVAGCSKYLLGIGLARAGTRPAGQRLLLRRHFVA
jgi:hypothetical protein